MEERPESNTDLKSTDVFTAVNNYFLLFFCGSCVLGSLYLQQLFLYMGLYRAGVAIAPLLAIILPIYLLLRRVGPGFALQIRLAPPQAPRVLYVLMATLATVVIVDQIYLVNQQFSPVPPEYIESLKNLRPSDGWSFAVIFAGLCVLVPISEEMVFRGLIQQVFSRNMGGGVGFVLAGLVFGAIHLNAHLLVSISFFGIFLSFIYYATGNLAYAIIAHSIFNTIALLQLTLSDTAETTDLPFYLQDVRIFVVSAVLLVFFLYKIKAGGSETEPPTETDNTGENSI
jgi:membrane protease YdiL (CAAX protease family)